MRIPHILPCLVLLLAACTENLETNYITFRVSDEDYLPAPEVATRAVAEAPAVLPLESNLDEDLVLMTTIEDGINLPMQPATRGAQTGTGSMFAFGVSEYASNGTTAVTNFQNVQFSGTSAQPSMAQTVNSGKTWESNAADNAYRFYAYSPTLTTGTASNGLTLQSGNKTITYDCTSVSVANQQDLMTAYASSTYNSNGVALAFGHRLCAVKIQLAAGWNTSYTIKGVSFSSVVKSGTVSLEDGSWSSLGAAGAYTPADITETSSASGGVAVYLMMVPQTLSSCVMTVTLQKSGESYQSTLKATLDNNTWGAGKTVTYTISPSAITSVTVTYPASWSSTSGTTTITGPVTTYTTTDSFGLFAVDKDGKIVISNLQITAPTANAASQTITLPSGPLYSQQYTYYIYYPYQSTLTTTYSTLAAGQTYSGATTADTFFANVISGWTVATDQSGGVQSSDLQVAKHNAGFSMAHKMGLVKVSMSAHNVYDNLVYNGNTFNSASKTWTVSSYGTCTEWNGSSTFTSSDKPLVSGTNCYQIVKPNVTTLSYATSTVEASHKYAWNQDCVAITTAGQYETYDVDYDVDFIAATWLFSYSGSGQQWEAPKAGTYSMECWGASGGAGMVNKVSFTAGPGKGGYTYGRISLSLDANFYVYVGGRGEDMVLNGSRTYKDAVGGWNGGGLGAYDRSDDDGDGAGGGATDIRLTKAHASDYTVWNNFASLKSRIMVAGGGGGGGYRVHYGGCGGNTTGGQPWYQESGKSKVVLTDINPGSQTSGYKFGQGQDGRNNPTSTNETSAGGGGGYYGGQAHQNSPGVSSNSGYPAPGGSSFISGYTGCNAIKQDAASDAGGSSYHTGSPNHYSGLVFTSGNMINGDNSMPKYSGSGNMTGNSGDGYCRIIYIPN